MAISCRQLRFRRQLSTIRPGTARLPRAQKRPRNDNSGGVTPQNPCATCCWPAWRSLSAATDAIGATVLTVACTDCKCLPEIATGAKRPRNDKSIAFSILTVAGTNRLCCAGPAHCCRSEQAVDKTGKAKGLSLRGGRRPTWQSRAGNYDFADSFPTIWPGTARLPRAQSTLAMTILEASRHRIHVPHAAGLHGAH